MPTLVVETGSGQNPTANSYVDLDYASNYHDMYGNTDWPVDDSDGSQTLALIQATRAVDALYGAQFRSWKLSDYQLLQFPRDTFFDRDFSVINEGTIPWALKNAVCEMALQYVDQVEPMDPEDPDNYLIQQSISLDGVASTKNVWTQGVVRDLWRKVTLLINPLLKGKQQNIKLAR